MRRVTLIDAMADPNLFAPWFRDAASWSAWRAFLSALFALPMPDEQLAIYNRCTGRAEPPTAPAAEGWLVCGRRAGKSFILALIAVFLATFYDYRRYLAPGERGSVIVIATNTRQAREIYRSVRALLTGVPMLRRMIERETADTFDLTDGVTIEVGTTSFKTVRGYTIVAALCDELAFWPTDDSAEPDYEVLNALRPGMVTIPNAMLLCASSPYARRGALWDAHRRHFGKDDDPILVWHADTRTMNPTVPQRVIDEATERDPAWAAAEYGAQFRSDVQSFVISSTASSAVANVGHREATVVVVDAVREVKPPFSPEDVVDEFATLLKRYRIVKVTGDRYAGEWPREQFRKLGISYEPAAEPKSDLYRDLLPAINSRRIDLLDHPRLVNQLVSLERRTARGGRDSIDHAPGAHDDIANVVAGVSAMFAKQSNYDMLAWFDDEPSDLLRQEQLRFNRYIMSGGLR